MDQVVIQKPALKSIDRSLFAPSLDLVLAAVLLRVEHRMRAEAIGPAFEKLRPATGADFFNGTARRALDRDDIHAVDGSARHAICGGLAEQIGFSLGPL